MRLFLAVDLDESARAECRRVSKAVAGRLARAGLGGDVKWVPAENLHITIRFIGHVDDCRAAKIQSSLEAPLPIAGFDAALTAAGAFPTSGAARVLWIGVGEGSEALAAVHDAMEDRLRRVGLEPEDRPFAAHLTLARFRTPPRAPASAVVRRILAETQVKPVRWRVGGVTLYESRLSPKGPIYAPLVRTPLAPDPRAGA